MPILAAAPTIAKITTNAVRYIVSGSARSALKKVIKELNKYYTKGKGKYRKVKPSAKAIEEKAKRLIAAGTKEAKKQAPSAGKGSIKQGGAFSQTSKTAGITPLRIKDSGKVIPKSKTKIGSIPLKTTQQPKPGISTKVKKPTGKYSRKLDTKIQRNKPTKISDKSITPFTVNTVKKPTPAQKANLTRLQKLVDKVKRNKVKTIAGVGLATSAIVATNKLRKDTSKKSASKKTTESSKKIQQRNSGADQKFIRTNFASPKNLENYRGRRGGINVRKKKKK